MPEHKDKKQRIDGQKPKSDQGDQAAGNTSTAANPRARSWAFTYNNYDQKDIDRILAFLKNAQKYVFQEETGENGTPHLQGFARWTTKKGFKWVKSGLGTKVHLEKTKSEKKLIEYCQKEETRSGKMWHKGVKVCVKVVDPFDAKQATEWQVKILGDVKEKPDPRMVYWYWSESGGIGKTFLCKHLCLTYNCILVGGKKGDILYAVSKWIEEKGSLDILIINLPRSEGNRCSYSSIESVKDGLFFSTKYESTMCFLNPPHILVFANSPPETSKLSADRWIVTKLD